MNTEQIERASALILAAGSPRDREVRAYYHARGRFADLVALAATLAPLATVTQIRRAA